MGEQGGPDRSDSPASCPPDGKDSRPQGIAALVAELRRRRIFRALLGWGVFAFAVLQVVEPMMHGLDLPDWTLRAVIWALAAGFPITSVLAWVFDLRAGGITVTPPPAGGSVPASRRRLALGGLVVASILLGAGLAAFALRRVDGPQATPPSIAVLPFVDMSPGKDQEYFSDGIAEEVLNALAQMDGLRVSGRTSSFSFKGRADDLRAIGQKLGVATVLEGSVRKAGTRVRITAQLVKTADGFHLWSKTFDRDLSDVFAVQDEIAHAVVDALKVKLLPGQGGPSRGATPVREAYDHYLLGRDLVRTGDGAKAVRALSEFEKATALDPSYAQAWAGIANTLRWIEGFAVDGPNDPARRRRALEAAERAISLGPDLSDGYVARARIRRGFLLDWAGARADLERARRLGPGDASVAWVNGQMLMTMGNLPDAAAELSRAVELDPLSAQAWTTLGQVQTSSGEHERGRASLAKALEIAPQLDEARYYLYADLIVTGRAELALTEAERSQMAWIRLPGVAMAQHALGHPRESQAALDALVAAHAGDSAYQIAEVHAWRGEKDKAFEWLERARVQADTGLGWIKVDPLLASIRGDPRYGALLRKLNLPADGT